MSSLEYLVTPSTGEILFLIGVASFVVSLIALPLILVWLPAKYFTDSPPKTWLEKHHPSLRGVAMILKNLLGLVLLLGGLAMLVLPGQGLLTIFLSLSLLDFPGKRALQQKIVERPMVLQTINSIRRRFKQPPLDL